ncbi:MAG: radical SAM protein [Selenomonadaceae bacterium]|nr:radical SAM protein [Selenomonadaceae bacterium]
MTNRITALTADEKGNIFDVPEAEGVGRIGEKFFKLKPDDLIKLPDSADLMFLPDRKAIGLKRGEFVPLKGRAVSAILPQGYTRTHLPAYKKNPHAKYLPLYGYTAVVLYRDDLYAAAIYTDENHKWNPENYNTRDLKKLIRRVKKDLPDNRIVEQVANCSLEWHCLTAQNLFYRRWECGVPTSPTCNANCLGCISLQQSECCPSPQSRITFKPTVDEIANLGIYHLSHAPESIISFGQGCEGEPSLMAENISAAIKKIRESTDRGQININTNAGFTSGIKKIVDAGLNSMRVSIISARDESYQRYYRAAYKLDDVKNSIRYALDNGVHVSLNMLYMPGFNDETEELTAWKIFLNELPVNMIQVRNLNYDPDAFFAAMNMTSDNFTGTKKFLRELQKDFPALTIGNFSHYVASDLR